MGRSGAPPLQEGPGKLPGFLLGRDDPTVGNPVEDVEGEQRSADAVAEIVTCVPFNIVLDCALIGLRRTPTMPQLRTCTACTWKVNDSVSPAGRAIPDTLNQRASGGD